jgi:hypothetical protein
VQSAASFTIHCHALLPLTYIIAVAREIFGEFKDNSSFKPREKALELDRGLPTGCPMCGMKIEDLGVRAVFML